MAVSGIDTLSNALRGCAIRPGGGEYERARGVYNRAIDKRPALICRCADAADVIASVNFARDNNLLLAVRGGGHSGPGLGVCENGLVIDCSPMNGVRIDPGRQTARAGGGAVWGAVDHAAHAFGLASVNGIISTTGVGGLTLGGGHGYLSRKYGLTIDNLLEADVVLADGSFVTASEDWNQDLFWALRGGGGNFVVVTSFLFRLRPVASVTGGPTFWPPERAAEAMRWYADFIEEAPEDLYGWFGFAQVPPMPQFPRELHGRKMAMAMWCHTGPEKEAAEALAPVENAVKPVFHGIHAMPFPALQSAFDGLYPPGYHWYWKGGFVKELPDEAIQIHLEHGLNLPTPQSTMHLYPINGAVRRTRPDETAWSYRDATWSMAIAGVSPNAADMDRIADWARDYWEALLPHAMEGGYTNFMMDEGGERVRSAHRDNYERLAKIKSRYDPDNFFRVNHNIEPKPSPAYA